MTSMSIVQDWSYKHITISKSEKKMFQGQAKAFWSNQIQHHNKSKKDTLPWNFGTLLHTKQ